jgi:hypothetical protein
LLLFQNKTFQPLLIEICLLTNKRQEVTEVDGVRCPDSQKSIK